jgi:hypothetical protein
MGFNCIHLTTGNDGLPQFELMYTCKKINKEWVKKNGKIASTIDNGIACIAHNKIRMKCINSILL